MAIAGSDVVQLMQRIEDDLIRAIARRLTVDPTTGAVVSMDVWRTEKLMDIGALDQEAVQLLSAGSKAAIRQIEQAILSLGLVGAAGIPTIGLAQRNPVIDRILNQSIQNVERSLNLVKSGAKQMVRKSYTNAVNQAYLETTMGIKSHQQATRDAIKSIAEHGISSATYVSAKGRKRTDTLEVAVRRNVVTMPAQCAAELQLERCKMLHTDLVEVSSHPGARPSHAEWQGQIYSLSGKHPKYRDFYSATGYGTVGGLAGANCSHEFHPFVEGVSERRYYPIDPDENQRVYEERQIQRQLEREIRKQKRITVAFENDKNAPAAMNAQRRLQQKQKELRDFTSKTGRTRRRDREQTHEYRRGVIARSQSGIMRRHDPVDVAKQAKDKRESLEMLRMSKKYDFRADGTFKSPVHPATFRAVKDTDPPEFKLMDQNLMPPTDEYLVALAKVQGKGLSYTPGKIGEDRFYFDGGKPLYPPNDGAVGDIKIVTLKEGTILQSRYGRSEGYYTSPDGTPLPDRALHRYARAADEHHRYLVVGDIEKVEQGTVAPWFDQPGRGLQNRMPDSIVKLINKDLLKEVP